VATPGIQTDPRTEVLDGRLRVSLGPELDPCVVAVVGELDCVNVPTLEHELDRLLIDGRHVILDLEGVEFIDSCGIRCLFETARESRANGDRLRILGVLHPHVERVLRMVGAHERLPFVA
jgi:anti-sigma B factor antagonist